MILDDVPGAREPERGELGKDLAFIRNGRGNYHIIGGYSVRRDHKQAVINGVEVANFTAELMGESVECCFEDGGHRSHV